jgi:hypothetical protein
MQRGYTLRHSDACGHIDSVNMAFGTNNASIKQKSLRAVQLLRDAESVVKKMRNFIDDCTVFV